MAINFDATVEENKKLMDRDAQARAKAVRHTVYEVRKTATIDGKAGAKVITKLFSNKRAACEWALKEMKLAYQWRFDRNFTMKTGLLTGTHEGEYGFEFYYDKKLNRVVTEVRHKHIYMEA